MGRVGLVYLSNHTAQSVLCQQLLRTEVRMQLLTGIYPVLLRRPVGSDICSGMALEI